MAAVLKLFGHRYRDERQLMLVSDQHPGPVPTSLDSRHRAAAGAPDHNAHFASQRTKPGETVNPQGCSVDPVVPPPRSLLTAPVAVFAHEDSRNAINGTWIAARLRANQSGR